MAEAKFSVTFQNGALEQLKKIAAELGIEESRLGDVLRAGVTLMDVAKEGHNVTIIKNNERYVIDLRRLK